MKRRRPRAFSMIEAAVTLAIMAIVATAAISAFAAFSRLAKHAERDVVLIETLRTGLFFLLSEIRDAGGSGVQPWAAVIVEDNCGPRDGFPDCRGSDRLTLVQGIPSYPGCRVIDDRGGRLQFEEVDAACCFVEDNFARQVALVLPDTMQPVLLRGTGADCVFTATPIVPAGALARPLGDSSAHRSGGWRGGVAILVDVKTFYVDWTIALAAPGATPEVTDGPLTMHAELNGDGDVVGERLTVLERVADFQSAIGYDVAGRPLLESSTGVGDSWWPGLPEETGRASDADRAFEPERAVFIGVSAIAVVAGGHTQTLHLQTPWGPPRALRGLRATVGADRVGLPSE